MYFINNCSFLWVEVCTFQFIDGGEMYYLHPSNHENVVSLIHIYMPRTALLSENISAQITSRSLSSLIYPSHVQWSCPNFKWTRPTLKIMLKFKRLGAINCTKINCPWTICMLSFLCFRLALSLLWLLRSSWTEKFTSNLFSLEV